MREAGRLLQGRRVDCEHIFVRQEEADAVGVVEAPGVAPLARRLVPFDDHGGERRVLTVGGRARQRAAHGQGLVRGSVWGCGGMAGWHLAGDAGLIAPPGRPGGADGIASGRILESPAHHRLVNHAGLVARVEDRGVNRAAVGADGQRAGGVSEELDNLQRLAAHAPAGLPGVEYPDIRPADPCGVQSGVSRAGNVGDGRMRALLTAVRGGDEGPALGEDDVARFVAHQERARHERHPGFRGLGLRQRLGVDDADRVRKMVDHPNFGNVADRDGDRFQTHGDGGCVGQGARIAHRKGLKPIVGRVDNVEQAPVRGQGHGTHRARFECDEFRRLRGREVECTGQRKPDQQARHLGPAPGWRDVAEMSNRWRY